MVGRRLASATMTAAVFVGVALIAYAPFYVQLDRERKRYTRWSQNNRIGEPGSQPVHFLLHWLPLFVIVALSLHKAPMMQDCDSARRLFRRPLASRRDCRGLGSAFLIEDAAAARTLMARAVCFIR